MRVAGSWPGSIAANSWRYRPRGPIAPGSAPPIPPSAGSGATSRESPHAVLANGAGPECTRSEARIAVRPGFACIEADGERATCATFSVVHAQAYLGPCPDVAREA